MHRTSKVQKEKQEGYEHRKPKQRTKTKKYVGDNVIFSLDTIKQL